MSGSGVAGVPGAPGVGTVLRRLPRAVRGQLRTHDLALHSAAVTFYAAISGVPMVLLAGRLATAVIGREHVLSLADAFGHALPNRLGAGALARAFLTKTTGTSWWVAVVVIFPASLYGEGLRRAYASLAGVDERGVGWRGRLALLPALAVAPLLLLGVLGISPLLAHLFNQGTGATALGVYVALNVDWIVVSIPLIWSFRVVAPDPPSWGIAIVGGLSTGAFISGFLQGFTLFLTLPIDLGAPFGGMTAVGAVTAGLFWVWLLHLVSLLGYVATRQAQRMRSAPVPGAVSTGSARVPVPHVPGSGAGAGRAPG